MEIGQMAIYVFDRGRKKILMTSCLTARDSLKLEFRNDFDFSNLSNADVGDGKENRGRRKRKLSYSFSITFHNHVLRTLMLFHQCYCLSMFYEKNRNQDQIIEF